MLNGRPLGANDRARYFAGSELKYCYGARVQRSSSSVSRTISIRLFSSNTAARTSTFGVA